MSGELTAIALPIGFGIAAAAELWQLIRGSGG
jgi:hypothetical protein